MTVFQIRLEQALQESGLTPADLSRRSGVAESTLSSYRSGAYAPRNKKLYAIATALNVSPSWLMGYDLELNEDALDLALQSVWSEMSDEQKRQTLDYMRFLTSGRTINT